MNHIEAVRKEMKALLENEELDKVDSESVASPCGKYKLQTTNFWLKDSHWNITQVEVYHHKKEELLFRFNVNEDRVLYEWLSANDIDYLICAEDIFGGQTIIDLTNKQLESYSPNEDGFIWTDFHLSPDGKLLATIGCYWACPYVIKVYDFSNPMVLPLKEIKEIELLDNDEVILKWNDNTTLLTKGVKRLREPEYFDDGSMRMKIIAEEEVNRTLKIDED